MAKGKGKTKAAAAPVVEVENDEVDEVEADEVEEEAPAKGGAQEVTFGVADLVKLIKEKTGKDTTTRELRTLLRKMARDNRINREIVPGNRTRYDWSGPEDPEVKAVVKAFKAGELDADKKEKLDALKQRKAEQKAAKEAEAKKAEAAAAKKSGKKAAAKPAPEPEVEDDDEDLDDDDE